MDVLPTGGGRPGLRTELEFHGGGGEARLESQEEEAIPAAPPAPPLRGVAEPPRGSRDSWDGDEDTEPGEARGVRTSRTASLVSGLLNELYSCTEEEEAAAGGGRGAEGRRRRRDSLDSSTEASGSDVVLGGRSGAGDSRVLQELQERPSQRHQMLYLRQKGEGRAQRGAGGLPGAGLSSPSACAPARTWAARQSAQILSLWI
ncbi:PREDICTED: TBC1 domain family member 30-like [Cercocebus atys]|uniref:TBC1 domain family member 30-like n=1 Tax=Cercocebus atys TaxID=9531 RepID=UPI0005F3D184|nr:PREDICTED: TBC1 domain family member 30-like [Cercocebus atys]